MPNIDVTLTEFEMLKKLVRIVVEAKSIGVAQGEGKSGNNTVEWDNDKVEITIE